VLSLLVVPVRLSAPFTTEGAKQLCKFVPTRTLVDEAVHSEIFDFGIDS
jgi:hypothetical protein